MLDIFLYRGTRYYPPPPPLPPPGGEIWKSWAGIRKKRIKTQEKTKVVAPVWGSEFIQFLAALAILHSDNFEE